MGKGTGPDSEFLQSMEVIKGCFQWQKAGVASRGAGAALEYGAKESDRQRPLSVIDFRF